MASLSQFQHRRIAFLFLQYSGTVFAEALTQTGEKQLVLDSRLTPLDFHHLLNRLGPIRTMEQAKQLIYDYDSSLTGALGYEDFFEFLNDYSVILEAERTFSTNYWNEMSKTSQTGHTQAQDFIDAYPDVQVYLNALGLSDPESYFKAPIQNYTFQDMTYVSDPNFLRRGISIRVFSVTNTECISRLKKGPNEIKPRSLDALLKIKCGTAVRTTTIVEGELEPSWDQNIHLTVNIPPGPLHEVLEYVESHNIEFMLYDAQSSPTVPWLELLATCYIPLVRVLLSSKKPLSVVFKMSTLSHVSEHLLPRLEIALFDLTQERFTWAKFVDNVPIMEEVWQAQFEDKIAQDLGKRSSWIPSFHYTDTTPSLVYTLLSTTIKGLRELFRHRHFRFIGVDEFKQFRFLTSFVQSINPKVLGLNNMLEIASAVADIPYLGPRVNHTMHERFHGSTLISSWNTKGVVGSYVSETFYEPIGSPATMIGRRYGSLQEHAILLCSLFKGLGVKAYVTVGEIKRRRYIWVTTITEREKATELIGLDVSPAKENELYQQTQFYDDHGGEPVTFDGFGFKKKDTVQSNAQFRRVYDVLQWDPISGMCYDSMNHELSDSMSYGSYPFDRIDTIFDNENIYYNIQTSNLSFHPTFSWDLENQDHWLPFFQKNSFFYPGCVATMETSTSILNQSRYRYDILVATDTIIKELVDMIKGYRANVLYIPNTYWHRQGCQAIQQAIEIRVSQIRNTKPYEKQKSDTTFLAEIEKIMTPLLPDHHYWSGSCFDFLHFNTSSIVENLVECGVLDCTIPEAMFTIGVALEPRNFGMVRAYLVLGYVADVLAGELYCANLSHA